MRTVGLYGALLWLLSASATATVIEVTTSGSQSVSATANVSYTYTVMFGPVTNFSSYHPKFTDSDYEKHWRQAASNSPIATSLPGEAAEFPLGTWFTLEGDFNGTLTVQQSGSATIVIDLPGAVQDLSTGSGSWYEPTRRIQSPLEIGGLQQTVDGIVNGQTPDSPKYGLGVYERAAIWIKTNRPYSTSGGYAQNDALNCYLGGSCSCAGHSNLHCAILRAAGYGCGVTLGVTLSGTQGYFGVSHFITVTTQSGLHLWVQADVGDGWYPAESRSTVGTLTPYRMAFVTCEDESDCNPIIVYSRPIGSPAYVTMSTSITGSSASVAHVARLERDPAPGVNLVAQYIANAMYKAEVTTDVGGLIERRADGAHNVFYNRGADWIEGWLRLPRDGRLEVDLFDVAGRRSGRSIDERRGAGTNVFLLRAEGLATGIYIVRVRFNGAVETAKVVVIR